jgi:molecular chaperone DnaK (HSP70)
MIQPIIDRTVGPCKQALKDAGLKPEQIDEVVLVGGSTRIPKVRRLVQDLFQRVPHTDLNPDEVVALGAAVQANILGGGSEITKEMLLLDVTPLSLGIEVAGGVTDKIILRNSTIPASATQYYTTQVDGQTNVAIHVLQGERELARDCRSLARFDLKGVPPMPAGMPRIEVKFLIDANGILRVSAREQRSGKEAEIDVQPTYGLTDEQVENMLLESFDYAEEDFRQRQVIEARREADTILTALAKGQKESGLAGTEAAKNAATSRRWKSSYRGKGWRRLSRHPRRIDALNKATMRLAELMMDTAVSTALKGKAMDDTGFEEGPQAGHPVAKADFE